MTLTLRTLRKLLVSWKLLIERSRSFLSNCSWYDSLSNVTSFSIKNSHFWRVFNLSRKFDYPESRMSSNSIIKSLFVGLRAPRVTSTNKSMCRITFVFLQITNKSHHKYFKYWWLRDRTRISCRHTLKFFRCKYLRLDKIITCVLCRKLFRLIRFSQSKIVVSQSHSWSIGHGLMIITRICSVPSHSYRLHVGDEHLPVRSRVDFCSTRWVMTSLGTVFSLLMKCWYTFDPLKHWMSDVFSEIRFSWFVEILLLT